MTLAILAFFGGVLTILSPCTLPVLPFVFAKTDRPFARSTLPLLVGMALTFAAIATLAAVGGNWAVRLNAYGRVAALILLGLFGAALLSKRLAEWLARPAIALGNRLAQSSGGRTPDVAESALLGVATGLLWAPCAGPILGLILTGAAIRGPGAGTSLLLLAYALGAATSLALATLAGRQIFALMRRSLNVGEWVRRGLGVLVLAAVAAIGLGWDTGVLTRLSIGGTNRLEQALLDKLPARSASTSAAGAAAAMKGPSGAMSSNAAMSSQGAMMMSAGAAMAAHTGARALPVEGDMPELNGAVGWINSAPLSRASLRGKVVLVDFWTYSCINCLRTLPYLRAWYQRYKDYGLVIVGVHSPEFAFEKDIANVRRAVHELGLEYPVAVDSRLAIWQAFDNQYWPADYFVDANGQIRGHQFGEGDYDGSERIIRTLLQQSGHTDLPAPVVAVQGSGIEAAPDESDMASPETYIGYERAQHFSSSGSLQPDKIASYDSPSSLQLNQWALAGRWLVSSQRATLESAPGQIVYRFRARDLHLVLGPSADGKPIRFRVRVDGHEPGADHGVDTDAHGAGIVQEHKLYQLIRQPGGVEEHTFSIEFLDPGVQAYSFTFG